MNQASICTKKKQKKSCIKKFQIMQYMRKAGIKAISRQKLSLAFSGKYFSCIFLSSRSWCRHYTSITDLGDRRKVHNLLIDLMEEVDVTNFQTKLLNFFRVWEDKWPVFVHYFRSQYATEDRICKGLLVVPLHHK